MASMQKFAGRVVILALGLAMVPFAGMGQSKKPAAKTHTLSADEKMHLKYIMDHTARVIPHKLNLADPVQYAYVMDILRRAGRTNAASPQLFHALAAARKGKAGPPVMMTTADMTAGDNGATLGGLNYVPKFGLNNSTQNYETNAYSSYPTAQLPYNTQVFMSLIDVYTGAVIGTDNKSVFSTTNVQVPVNGAAPANPSNIVANALFLVAAQKGAPLTPYSVVLEDKVAGTTGCQLSPAYYTPQQGQQQCQTNANTACVVNPSKAIKVCYGNRIQSDCDYGCTGSSNPPNIIFPIQGSVNMGATPANPLVGSLYIVMNEINGGCVLLATANTTTNLSQYITPNGNVASWNLAPAQFPNQNCFAPTNAGTAFNYMFQLFLVTASGYSGATFTSDQTQWGLPDTFPVPTMTVLIGCLPDGVKIRMADGSEKAVEDFRGGGDEFVNSTDANRSVSAITWGNETQPLVYLRDSLGHTLMLTEGHPVITARGSVAASALKVGDVVLTESGNAELVEVGRRESPAPVPIHNLRVGTEEEALAGKTTFYANGILVGDEHMQRMLVEAAARPRQLSNAEILHSLPPEWRQDFLNSLKHK